MTRAQRITLLAAILGLVRRRARRDGRQRRTARDPGAISAAGSRAAVGLNAYLLTLGSLILIGGSLGDLFGERRVFMLGVGGFGVASLSAPSRRRSAAGRRAGAAGRGRRAADAELARAHRRGVPARRARRGDRLLDGVERDRVRHRAAGRRRARRRRVVALDLRHQRAVRPRRRWSRRAVARRAQRGGRARSTGSAPCCAARAGRAGLRAHRAAALRAGRSR